MSKTWNYQPAGTFDVSTTGNIDDLDFQSCALIRMTNATLATIRGLKAGYPGQRVTIASIGAGQVDLPHQNTNSAAANRLINPITSAAMSLAAGFGTGDYEYDDTTARWRQCGYSQGNPIVVAYAAGNFGTGVGTWTVDAGDQVNFQYALQSAGYVVVWFDIRQTSTTGTPGALDILVPGGFTVAGVTTNNPGWGQDNAVTTALLVQPAATGGFANNAIRCFRQDLAAWANATNATQVRAQLAVPVT